jgi:DNA-binding FrmR family transcriptional regulator
MKNYQQRLNIIVGQLKGIEKMIDREDDCSKVLVQFQAVKSAMGSLMNKYLEENLLDCLQKSCSEKNKKKMVDLIKKITKDA